MSLFKSNEKGFTLVELVVVIAIIGFLGAILVPNFMVSSDKVRLKSDVQSAITIQSAIELYNSERKLPMTETSVTGVLTELKNTGYLGDKAMEIQTSKAKWVYNASATDGKYIIIDITGCDTKIRTSIYESLNDNEKNMVKAS